MSETASKLRQIQHEFSLDIDNSDHLNNIMGDADDVFDWLQRGQKNLTLAAMDHEDANESEKISEVDANFRQLLDLEKRLTNQKTTFQTIKRRIDQGEKMKDLFIPYENIQHELLDRTTSEESKYLTNTKYISFRQNIWNINHPDELMPNLVENDDDDDIVMGSTKISMKCPLTTTWLENPMTCKTCKHTYSKDAVMNLLRQTRGNTTCPVSGCNKWISVAVLEVDDVMADRVARSRARDQKNATTTQYFDVE